MTGLDQAEKTKAQKTAKSKFLNISTIMKK